MKVKFLSALALGVLLSACACDVPEDAGVTLSESDATKDFKATFCQDRGDRVFFAFDKSDLTEEAKAVLDRQIESLKGHPEYSVTLVGNCDERGTRAYNYALGERRAYSVLAYMKAHGMDMTRVSACSMGKDYPTVSGSGEEAWSQNRNVITLLKLLGSKALEVVEIQVIPGASTENSANASTEGSADAYAEGAPADAAEDAS